MVYHTHAIKYNLTILPITCTLAEICSSCFISQLEPGTSWLANVAFNQASCSAMNGSGVVAIFALSCGGTTWDW